VWTHHSQYGWQFKVEAFRSVLPATAQGIRKYLGSGLIKGVGPRTAEKIVAHFDTATLDVLESDPSRLAEVPGIGGRKTALIARAWAEQKSIKEVMMFLQGHGVSTSLAARIYKQYGDAAIAVARNQPYRLARDVWGIGFKTADKIAQAMGVAADDPERLKAGALYALSEAGDSGGHTCLPRPRLVAEATELLGARPDQVEAAVEALIIEQAAVAGPVPQAAGRQVAEERPAYGGPAIDIYLPPFYYAEQGIANHLTRLARWLAGRTRLAEFQSVNAAVMFDYLERKNGLALSEPQKQGVLTALTRPVSILTGGPGTGKTTSMRALIGAALAKKKRVILAAPTGRAAKRLSEAAGLEARTLHRLLELRPGGKAAFDQDNPLPADLIIVDEVSMLDTLLMNTLLKAVAGGTHVLLVGDPDQLPSVGAGNVLADVIATGVAPITRLEHIFRQGEGSAMISNAHRINRGELPLTGADIEDFFLFKEEDPDKAADLVIDLVSRRIPARFGLAPADIQVLSPGHRGACGVVMLNQRLQTALNPARTGLAEKPFGSRVFRTGDRVMQLANNYDRQVFNGDAGVVQAIDLEQQELAVRLDDGRAVQYAFSDLDELALAYAVSVHKSQGSEYPACVIPLTMTHYPLLERKLLYTAVTRARKLAVLVGNPRALAIAVRNGPQAARAGRHTGLADKLARALAAG
jgi:exodeoxyribonuclease V alpha subunit